MNKRSTSALSELNLFALLILPLFVLASCSARVELDDKEQQQGTTATVVAPKDVPTVTVAAYNNAADEVYFDLIANTAGCMGEDLWLGGKLERDTKVSLANSGAVSHSKVYRITELTATGLQSNSVYLVNNQTHTLKATTDKDGTVYLQLAQGQLQLLPDATGKPVVLAYQPNPVEGYYDGTVGSWRCK